MVDGLVDGTIDVIASDHCPQDEDSKRLPFAQAEFGVVGLETLLPIALELVHNGTLGLIDLPIDFIRENIALYAGLGYAFILLMIFPIFNAVESLDHNQIEAARDLGSPWWRIHYRVVMC